MTYHKYWCNSFVILLLLNLPIRLSVNISQMFVHYLIDSGCKEDCDLITLGTYRAVDNYELNGAKDVVRCFHFWYLLCTDKLDVHSCTFYHTVKSLAN